MTPCKKVNTRFVCKSHLTSTNHISLNYSENLNWYSAQNISEHYTDIFVYLQVPNPLRKLELHTLLSLTDVQFLLNGFAIVYFLPDNYCSVTQPVYLLLLI